MVAKTPTRSAAKAASKPANPNANMAARTGGKSPGEIYSGARSKNRKFRQGVARTVSGSDYAKPGRSFLPFIVAAGVLTILGNVISSGPIKPNYPRIVIGSVVLLFFLTLLNEVSPPLATGFAILVLIRAILVHGQTVFGKVFPA